MKTGFGQRYIVRQSFWEPKTMAQVARETGIKAKNLCWYVREQRRQGTIYPMGRTINPMSHRPAGRYTTNPQRAWSHYVNMTQDIWTAMEYDEAMEIWKLIKGYVLNGFKVEGLTIPVSITDTWNKRIRPIIDGRTAI